MSAGDDHLIPSVEVTGKGKWIMKVLKTMTKPIKVWINNQVHLKKKIFFLFLK